jgi:carboxypeptidase family protein
MPKTLACQTRIEAIINGAKILVNKNLLDGGNTFAVGLEIHKMKKCIRVFGTSRKRFKAMRRMGVLLLVVSAIPSIGFSRDVVGRVYSEDGNPVKAASVTVQSTVARPSAQSKTLTSADQYKSSTDAQGKFILDLPDGPYTVCVRADKRGLLDSCQWFLSESIIQVREGFSQFKITLHSGLILRIRLNDPQGLLPQDATARFTSPVAARFTVYDALGYSHPVTEISGDDKGRNFEILVPPNLDYGLSVQSQNVDVVDAASGLASRAAAATVNSAKSNLAQTRVYEIVPSVGLDKGKGN